MAYSPKYTSVEAVKKQIGNKVEFSNEDDRYTTDDDVVTFIQNAEGYIERKLSRFYQTPFVNTDGVSFDDISDENTKQLITDACTWYASILILRKEFGDSTGSRGGTLYKYLVDSYNDFIYTNTSVNERGYPNYPPLTDLKLNSNSAYYQVEGVPMPLVADVGSASNNIAIRSQRRMTNLTYSWWGRNRFWR
jgi:hypothetical protein